MEPKLYRTRFVFPTREAAVAAGWADAEYGVWYSRDLARQTEGWLALSAHADDAE
jgi:hypothetical protein